MTDNNKKKQIEEMAKDVTGSIDWCRLEDDFMTVDCFRTAEALYEMDTASREMERTLGRCILLMNLSVRYAALLWKVGQELSQTKMMASCIITNTNLSIARTAARR